MEKLADARYADVESYLEAAMLSCRNDKNEQLKKRYFVESRPDFYGADCRNVDDVKAKISEGWQEGRERMQALCDSINTTNLVPQDRRRRLARADMGDELDMSAVYRGQFQSAWTLARRRSTSGPQKIDLLVNVTVSYGERPDVIFWRGAATVALADRLESAGYMVRIVVGFGGNTSGGEEPMSCRVTVKDYDKPLDVTTASAALLPGFFRAIGFVWVLTHASDKTSSGICHVREPKREQGEVYISDETRDEASAHATVAKIINSLNAENQEAA